MPKKPARKRRAKIARPKVSTSAKKRLITTLLEGAFDGVDDDKEFAALSEHVVLFGATRMAEKLGVDTDNIAIVTPTSPIVRLIQAIADTAEERELESDAVINEILKSLGPNGYAQLVN